MSESTNIMKNKDITTENGNNGDTVIKVEGLSKNFGHFTAVSKVSLEVGKSETVGLVGPNGAGKTTIIKMMARLLRPTSGRILLRNKEGNLQDLHKDSKNLVKMGLLIDVPTFYDMTAYQLLRYFANLQAYPKAKIDERIDELLKYFKLSDWKYNRVKTFSKGMRQKMGIIQALIHDPQIIILDEPQTGLDPKARVDIRKFIRELQNMGKTIFIASHMLYEISEVCDKIALINRGEIVAFDTLEVLEGALDTKEAKCTILEPILPENLASIIARMQEKLAPYLDKALNPEISKIPIKYNPYKYGFKIYYEGDAITRAEILKILIKDFESDFTIDSYVQPKTSSLERIYSQMITDERVEVNNDKKKRRK